MVDREVKNANTSKEGMGELLANRTRENYNISLSNKEGSNRYYNK